MLALGVPAAPKRWSAPLWVYQRTLHTRSRTNKPLILELLLINLDKITSKPDRFDGDHRKCLSTLMSSPHIVEGGIFEESREWPHQSKGPEVVSEVGAG